MSYYTYGYDEKVSQSTYYLENDLVASTGELITTKPGAAGDNISTDLATEKVERLYYHSNYLGSSTYMTDIEGTTRSYADYDEWGNVRAGGGHDINFASLEQSAGYTSYTYDKVLDKYFAQARMYDAGNRRFMSEDPIKSGMNWYGYVENSPVNFVDPSGEKIIYEEYDKHTNEYFRIRHDPHTKEYIKEISYFQNLLCEGNGGKISYLSPQYMQWLTTAEGYIPYPYRDTKDNQTMQNKQNVTLGIGFTFDNTGRNWDILKNVLGWTDNDIRVIISGAYSGTNYSNSKYVITQSQVYDLFEEASSKYMSNLNDAIDAFNNQNGYVTQYSQQELEAMFDYSYNNGLSATADTGHTYSSAINDQDQIIYYYLRKDLVGGVNAVKRFGNGERRRLNQMNLFFFDYNFLDSSGSGLNPLRNKLGF